MYKAEGDTNVRVRLNVEMRQGEVSAIDCALTSPCLIFNLVYASTSSKLFSSKNSTCSQ